MSTQLTPYLTPEQYLEIERRAEFRSEYIGGQLFAMAGGSPNHARIVRNTLGRLDQQLRESACEAFSNDLRLFIGQHQIGTYPDIVIPCGHFKYLDSRRDTLTDAIAIIEVLSPSTQDYDRGEKFRIYRSLPSFSEYLLLAQDAIRAEHHVRQPDASWLFREISLPTAIIELKSIGCRLQLDSLYERVEFDAQS
jgi:Uma2 family endonuclease